MRNGQIRGIFDIRCCCRGSLCFVFNGPSHPHPLPLSSTCPPNLMVFSHAHTFIMLAYAICTLQHAPTYSHILQHTAIHRNTLQHSVTQSCHTHTWVVSRVCMSHVTYYHLALALTLPLQFLIFICLAANSARANSELSPVRCRVWKCVAVCCSMLQCVAVIRRTQVTQSCSLQCH